MLKSAAFEKMVINAPRSEEVSPLVLFSKVSIIFFISGINIFVIQLFNMSAADMSDMRAGTEGIYARKDMQTKGHTQ